MSDDANKRTLTPKLRFPQFRDAPAWEEKPLKQVCDINPENSGLPESFVYIDLESVESGLLNATKRIERKDAPSRAQRLLRKGDVVFQIVRPYQRNNLFVQFDDNENYVASTGYAQLRAYTSESFLYHAIHADGFVDRVIAKCTGSSYPAINSSDLAEVCLPVPPSTAEQQKIADCLTSLDELIVAQGQKVEALKNHKMGLTQQLFPREDETLPRLRFPEFDAAPKWEERVLGPSTLKVGSGITPLGGDKNYKSEGRPFIRSQNVGWGQLILDDVVYIDEELHASFNATEIGERDVLLNITGASIGRSALADSRIVGGNVNQHVCIIRVKLEELNPVLLNQFLISDRGQKQIDSFQAGGNRQGLNFAQIRSFRITVPPTLAEQQKIADCLGSLDARLIAEAEKLAALKTHKKGLMQQLLPSPEAD
jgi:type I restriction enzyme S subunit